MQQIENNFNKILHKLITTEPLCLGVSGGSDSTAMLYLVKQYADIYHNRILVITVDHMLRKDSKDEAIAVHDMCTSLGLEHKVVCWHHGDIADGKIEEAARNARYDILINECRENDIKHLLIAHNADEQLETYFIRKNMHSEERGLACMSLKRTISDEIAIIRPCLSFSKKEMQNYLKNKHVSWFEDSMNDNTSFLRVRYRKEISLLSDSEKEGLLAEIRKLGRKRQEIELQSTNFLKTYDIIDNNGFASIPRNEFEKLEVSVQRDILKRLVKCIGRKAYSVSDAACDSFLHCSSSFCHSNVVVKKTKDRVIIYYENRKFEPIMHIDKGDKILWNKRFEITSLIDNLSIKTFKCYKNVRNLPSYIAASLPEFLINGKTVHIGEQSDTSSGFLCTFKITDDLYDVFLPF